jgi:hypothetical protein
VRNEVTLSTLIGLVATGYEVNRDPSATGQLIECGGHSSEDDRLDEAGTLGHQYLERVGTVENGVGDGPTFGTDGAVANEYTIESGGLVRLGDVHQIGGIDDGPVRPVDGGTVDQGTLYLRGVARAHHSDDLERHSLVSFISIAT